MKKAESVGGGGWWEGAGGLEVLQVQIGELELEKLAWPDRGLFRGCPRSPAVRGVAWGV